MATVSLLAAGLLEILVDAVVDTFLPFGGGTTDQFLMPWRGAVTAALALAGGWLLLAASPRYVSEAVDDLWTRPHVCLAWGVVAGVVISLGAFVFGEVFTGIVGEVPPVVGGMLITVVGNVVVFLGILDGLERAELWEPDERVRLVVVAGAAGAVSAIAVVGPALGGLVGVVGLGAYARRWRIARSRAYATPAA